MFKTLVNSIMDSVSEWILSEDELKAALDQLELCIKKNGIETDFDALQVIKKAFESLILKVDPEWVKVLNTDGQYMVIDHPTANEDMAVLIKSENNHEVYSKLLDQSLDSYDDLKGILESLKKSGLVKDFGVIMRINRDKIFQP